MTDRDPTKIGITGGIGSGKSTVSKIFETLGVPIYNSDERAMHLIHNNQTIVEKYKELFGENIYTNGVLNRKLVANKIFNNKSLLVEIQNTVHPIVRNDFKNWIKQQKSTFVINEAAILFESGSYKQMDVVVSVIAPTALRIKRVIERDHVSEKEVTDRIKNQWNDEQRIALSDYTIQTDDQQLVIPQVIDTYEKIQQTFTCQ